ncbi:MAG: hypothetical protein QMC67_09360 [Candidatus Wallbacteria bacterium]
MPFLLGILGFLQICFIPGAIIHRMWFGKTDFSEYVPASFALSLIINWCMVFLLTALKIYIQPVMILITMIEIFFLLRLFYFTQPQKNEKISLNEIIRNVKMAGSIDNIHNMLSILFCSFILFNFVYIIPYAGKIFTEGDAVISWNRWAVDWANNIFPILTWNYPQLLPANWSISYVIQGNTYIQFFAFASVLLFVPITLIFIYDSWKKTGHFYWLVFGLLYTLSLKLTHINTGYGYADVPVACLAVISLICLFNARHFATDDKLSFKYLLLSAIIAAGSAVTKQAGIYLVITYFIIVWHWSRNKLLPDTVINSKNNIKLIATNVLIWVVWYLFTQYRIISGEFNSEASFIMNDIHGGRTYIQRLSLAFNNWPAPFVASILCLPAIVNTGFTALSVMGIIFVFLWGFLLSYDIRNCIISFPMILISLSWLITTEPITRIFTKLSNAILEINLGILRNIFIAITIFTLAIVSIKFDQNYLNQRQEKYARLIGTENINNMIYKAFDKYGSGEILSNYQFIGYLPGTKGLLKLFYFKNNDTLEGFKNFESVAKSKYYLIPQKTNEEIAKYIKEQEKLNRIIFLESANGYTLYLKENK